MNIVENVIELINYGVENSLIEKGDKYYIFNRYIKILKIQDIDETFEEIERKAFNGEDLQRKKTRKLEEILRDMLDYAVEKGLIEEDTVTLRDLFDTELMAVMVSKPSEIAREFYERYKESPRKATDYYFDLSRATDYIRTYRVAKDMKWVTTSEYGDMR